MNKIRAVLLVLFISFVIMQLFRPVRNQNRQILNSGITRIYSIPVNLQGVLRTSCYDCHSNNTHYPWYAAIQPVSGWMAAHIEEGKAELNFSEFGNYSTRKQLSKLKVIAGSLEDGTMPLSSYTWLHKDAILSKKDKAMILHWVKQTRDSISLKNKR